ncbi:MAG: ABC transporter permease [Spirochaetota bacterium]|nr:MAG: ABC transporter permease [Spirochaetota bacterium]
MRIGLLKRHSAVFIVYVILAILILTTGLLSDVFLTFRNLENLLRQVAPLGFVSVGQTFAILTAGIDLSIGSVVSMTSVLTTGMIEGQQQLVLPVLVLVFGLAILIGFINGTIISKTGVHPLIVTLGMMSVVQGGILLYTKAPTGSVPISYDFVAWGNVWKIPFPILLFASVATIAIIFLRLTVFGRYVYATGGNEEVARLSGIKTGRVKTIVYMICSFTAALTGIMLASRMGMGDPLVGERYMLDSIIPVLIGGTRLTGGVGGVAGTIGGIFIFIILSNALNLLDVTAYWQWIVEGLVVIVSVSLYFRQKR